MTTVDDGTVNFCPVCSLCDGNYEKCSGKRVEIAYDCPSCGKFLLSKKAQKEIEALNDIPRAVLSHYIRNHQQNDGIFRVRQQHIASAKKESLPDPAEQLNRLILFLGNEQTAGEYVKKKGGAFSAIIGAVGTEGEKFILDSAWSKKLIDPLKVITVGNRGGYAIRLTMDGWQRFHELQRGALISRVAFMAMPFRDATVVRIVDGVFRPAVAETGFTLRRVDDEPKAGLIDDRIRVDIRMSRFLIADLTGGNQGAYWEAGYAEGLGKPVIYTCEKSFFEDKQKGVHFDTSHCTTVTWDLDNPTNAADRLKATIRATLPFEAKMPEE